jgi:hypothetical protein
VGERIVGEGPHGERELLRSFGALPLLEEEPALEEGEEAGSILLRQLGLHALEDLLAVVWAARQLAEEARDEGEVAATPKR